VTLSGEIDDVRVFPSDALMTSYTYALEVGETSETDPSGHSTIYQYDGFNRLTTVRDQDNNILKQYDYEFQACAHPVYNVAASNTYIRNNCSGGTPFGSEVTYNVPAGKYSACSLTAANQLATNDLAYNGQNYANATGSCSATAPCIPPINVAVSVYGAQLTVTWTYPPGVGTNAYAVIVKNAAGTTVEDPYGTASPTTITGLAYNTNYTVTVLSLCSGSPGSTPIPVTTGAAVGQAVNLTNLGSSPSGFCCHGCQYTSTVYSNTSTIAPGSLLYTNQALTQPLTGMSFIYPYNNNTSNYIYQLSGNTVTSTTVACH
jgi:YD repeat-containing protein